VTKLSQEFVITIHPNTLGVILKHMNFVWKRSRHSLKKRDELRFRIAQVEIKEMLTAADRRD
jgi:DNA-directed RNA polymerase subunit E'/Rpb7